MHTLAILKSWTFNSISFPTKGLGMKVFYCVLIRLLPRMALVFCSINAFLFLFSGVSRCVAQLNVLMVTINLFCFIVKKVIVVFRIFKRLTKIYLRINIYR